MSYHRASEVHRGPGAIAAVDSVTNRRRDIMRAKARVMAARDRRLASIARFPPGLGATPLKGSGGTNHYPTLGGKPAVPVASPFSPGLRAKLGVQPPGKRPGRNSGVQLGASKGSPTLGGQKVPGTILPPFVVDPLPGGGGGSSSGGITGTGMPGTILPPISSGGGGGGGGGGGDLGLPSGGGGGGGDPGIIDPTQVLPDVPPVPDDLTDSSSLISGVPNWALAAGGAAVLYLLLKKH